MDYHLQWQDLTAVQIADVLVALQLAKSDDKSNGSSPLGAIKAARWFAKLARAQVLDCLWSPVINSFLQTKIQHERKESCPFPLYVIVQWERRVLCEAASDAEVLILGGFLAILWAGLRFADAQRTMLSSLIFDLVSVRGSSFRTKTCHTGQPFGFLACGFLSAGDYSWVYKWLSTLDEYASRSSTINMDDLSLSFLIPSCDAGGPRLPLQPMSYAEALYWIRTFVHLPWKRQPCDFAVNFTVRSLKSTALSWASQLPEISEEERQRQGHHRGGSVKLYSRDDVSFQFRLQNKIIRAVQTGKRFLVPQHRGGQRPMIDPPFELERFQKEISERSWFAIHTCRAGEARLMRLRRSRMLLPDGTKTQCPLLPATLAPLAPALRVMMHSPLPRQSATCQTSCLWHGCIHVSTLWSPPQCLGTLCIRADTLKQRVAPKSMWTMCVGVSNWHRICHYAGAKPVNPFLQDSHDARVKVKGRAVAGPRLHGCPSFSIFRSWDVAYLRESTCQLFAGSPARC